MPQNWRGIARVESISFLLGLLCFSITAPNNAKDPEIWLFLWFQELFTACEQPTLLMQGLSTDWVRCSRPIWRWDGRVFSCFSSMQNSVPGKIVWPLRCSILFLNGHFAPLRTRRTWRVLQLQCWQLKRTSWLLPGCTRVPFFYVCWEGA